MAKNLFRVDDMECPSCAMRLESLEDDLPGITMVSASYRKLTMEVEYDESLLTVDKIIAAALKKGYHARLI